MPYKKIIIKEIPNKKGIKKNRIKSTGIIKTKLKKNYWSHFTITTADL